VSTWTTKQGTTLQLLNLKGKDYLPVAQRLIWFREERPNWAIVTQVEQHEKHTVARAEIRDETGRVLATAHKREDASHFADHLEKAEAGAIGRALSYVGYGTQFCADELDEGERIADSPQEKRPTRSAASVKPPAPASTKTAANGQTDHAEDKSPARVRLNAEVMRLYRPVMAAYPDIQFVKMLTERYGVAETRFMTTEQMTDLVAHLGKLVAAKAAG
jgi:hypothetical protein